MKLEEQCCTLEQAKRLKELGANYESQFYFVNTNEIWHKDTIGMDWIVDGLAFPAYTVAELGEMLPDGSQEENRSQIRSGKVGSNSVPRSKGLVYMCHYNDSNGRERTSFYAETEAQARAAMLIHLLENNLTPKP